jgi:hypothetical protein
MERFHGWRVQTNNNGEAGTRCSFLVDTIVVGQALGGGPGGACGQAGVQIRAQSGQET